MTVSKAGSLQAGRTNSTRAGALGLAIGLMAAFSGAHAAQVPTYVSMLPLLQAGASAVQPTGAVSVTDLDFRRGDGGSGKLVLRFDGDGAAPDLRTQGGSVVINLGGASLPSALQRPLNVTDFATPVQRIDTRQGAEGAQVVLSALGDFEPMAYQSGRDYIVEIIPRAAGSGRAVGAATTAATMGQSATATVSDVRAYSGAPVTFNFQDVPVRTVLQLIADESNLNIVASDSVTGSVTLRLQNVPWDQALDIVLQAKSLDKRRSGNVVCVAPQSEIASFEQAKEDARLAIEERAEMTTEYIPISYGNAEDIAKLLTDESKSGSTGGGASGGASQQRGFLSSRGSISFDRRTNTLLVIDIPNRVSEVKRLVNMLDKPVDQVIIEARIVIANESFARDLGARFGVSTNPERSIDGRVDVGGGFVAGENGTLGRPGALNVNLPIVGAPALGFTILGNTIDWNVELSALQQEERGEVISNPRIVTSNQREAVINQGQEVGYITVTGGQSNSVPTVEFKDVLLELKVTPTITNDGRVFLAMDIKKDEVTGSVNYQGIGSVPLISKRSVTTAVLIDDGQTVAVGGVYEFSDRSELSKVPFLGDLPILGNLFKSRGRNKEKAELLIFVTPKVMRVAQRPLGS